MVETLSKIVLEYQERHGTHPDFIEYEDVGGNKRTFFVVNDVDCPDMKPENLSFWELEEDHSFMEGARHSRLDIYYYPICPKHVNLWKKRYDFTGAVIYNNVIYVELGRTISSNAGSELEIIVISRDYDLDYMNKLEKKFNILEWLAIDEEQGEEIFESEKYK